jgi:hypothetical protein
MNKKTENRRDLAADLAICNTATEGPWRYSYERDLITSGGFGVCERLLCYDTGKFISEARTGWPHAIERAMAAERELPAARALLISMRSRAEEAEADVHRLRTAMTEAIERARWGDAGNALAAVTQILREGLR